MHLVYWTIRMLPQKANIVEGNEHGLFISGYLQSQLHEKFRLKKERELRIQSDLKQTNSSTLAGAESGGLFTKPVPSPSWARLHPSPLCFIEMCPSPAWSSTFLTHDTSRSCLFYQLDADNQGSLEPRQLTHKERRAWSLSQHSEMPANPEQTLWAVHKQEINFYHVCATAFISYGS